MTERARLVAAAAERGIETRWRDTEQVWHDVGDDTLRAVLEMLGPPPEPQHLPPVVVVRQGEAVALDAGRPISDAVLVLDDRLDVADAAPATVRTGRIEIEHLPVGRHRCDVAWPDGTETSTTVIVAPTTAIAAPRRASSVFTPLYALAGRGRGHGAGDLADLDRLAVGLAERDVDVLAILPIHPSFCGSQPFDPSPYAPVTRLHWNELAADLGALPGPDGGPAFDAAARRRAAALAAAPLVDWRGVASLVHDVLDAALQVPSVAAEVAALAGADHDLVDYARFRAHVERVGSAPPLDARLDQSAAEPAVARHVLGQSLLRRQLDSLTASMDGRGQMLALDLPVGSHPGGHEAWQRHRSFALGASVGAPPDSFFVEGQNWGFPPLHPEHARTDGHQLWHDVIDTVARRCGMLRIDHVMALHRLWWIPEGAGATEGAYVRFRSAELWATVAVTSEIRNTVIVGEDLGTVPDEVEDARRSWAVLGMYEEQFTADQPDPTALPTVPTDVVAGIRTHDMMPFAAFVDGSDADLRGALGVAAPEGATPDERARRVDTWRRLLEADLGRPIPDDAAGLYAAAIGRLGASEASVVVADLDDVLGQTLPHNVPGIPDYAGAWRRKVGMDVDALLGDIRLITLLEVLRTARASSSATTPDH